MSDETYREQIASLFGNPMPAMIMTGLFALAGLTVHEATHDTELSSLFVLGVAASVVRLGVLWHGGRGLGPGASIEAVAAAERWFAVSYLTFATVLGAFAARIVALPVVQLHTLAMILLVGYAAGASARTAHRPRICIGSLCVAVLPSCAVFADQPDAMARVCSGSLVALLVGGTCSVLERARVETANIVLRQSYANLARRDHLTGIANRLAFDEYLASLDGRCGEDYAIFCIDLDNFKLINDELGHAAGDELLKAVADRLERTSSSIDFVARVGGDEFVAVRRKVDAQDATITAKHIEKVLEQPYAVANGSAVIGASVGFALCADGRPPQTTVIFADNDLRARKGDRKRQSRRDATCSLLRASG